MRQSNTIITTAAYIKDIRVVVVVVLSVKCCMHLNYNRYWSEFRMFYRHVVRVQL